MSKKKKAGKKKDAPTESTSENPPISVPPLKDVVVTRKPLSYESSKTVLEYLDPNKRFQIATAIPHIRRINWFFPLKIDTLSFGDMSMTVNGTKYQFGINREFVKGRKRIKGFSHIEEVNKSGGATFDLNPYGLRDRSVIAASPGDIEFQDRGVPSGEWTTGDYERRLEELRIILKHISPRYQPLSSQIHRKELAEISLIERLLKGERSPFNLVFQLTIATPTFDETIVRVPYTFKLQEAFKRLTTNFFGETSKSIQVKQFNFDWYRDLKPIRLPAGLKLQVEKIKTGWEVKIRLALNKFTPILHLPALRCLEVDRGGQLMHPIVQNNLEQLVVNKIFKDDFGILRSHKNIKLLRWLNPRFDALINHWIETEREIGSSVTVNYGNEEQSLDILNEIREEPFVFRLEEDRKLVISVNEVSEIQLKIEEPDSNAEYCNEWSIRMEMMAFGTE